PYFALVPVGIGPDAGDRWQIQVVLGQGDLDHYVTITFQRQQVVEHREIGIWQASAVGAQALIDPVQVVEHDVGMWQVAQESQNLGERFARYTDYRDAGAGFL